MSRILIVADTFYPNVGGSETMLLQIARYCSEIGHEVCVRTPATSLDSVELPGIRIKRSSIWLWLQRGGGSPNKLVSRVSRALLLPYLYFWLLPVKADVMVAGHLLPGGLLVKWLKKSGRCRATIVMTYGEEVSMYQQGPRMAVAMASALNDADAVVCITQINRRELETIVPETVGKIKVIYPTVPVHPESQLPEVSLGGNPVLTTASRLVPRKGIDTTIEAVALLRSEMPGIRYYIVGTGPDEARLRKLVRNLELDTVVSFTGLVSSLRPYLKQCDIFCMPNRTMPNGEKEGFGIVFIEAGLEGKPSIAGNSGGAPEAVLHERTGLVVKPDDPEEMAAAIRSLVADPTWRKQMGDAARAHAEQFNYEQQGSTFDDLVAQVLMSRSNVRMG